MTTNNASDRYEIRSELASVGATKRFDVVEKSTGRPVRLYRVALDHGRDIESFTGDLQRDAQWRDVRLPQLIDAYSTDGAFEYVRMEFDGADPMSDEAQARLQMHGNNPLEEFAYQSLAALAGMHDFAIAHKRLALSCYVVTSSGLVFLLDTGVWKRMNDRAMGADEGTALGFSLVSNKERLDVAAWAAMVASMAGRKEFDTSGDDGTSAASPELVDSIKIVIERKIEDEKLAAMLVHALEAFGNPEGGGFESANQALAQFPRAVVA